MGDSGSCSLFEKQSMELTDPIRNSVLALEGGFGKEIFGCLILEIFRVVKIYILKRELIVKYADRFLIVF